MDKLTLTRSPLLPISVDEAKAWCRIDTDEEDDLVQGLILAATSAAEAETNRTLIDTQIEYRFPHHRRAYNIPTCPVRQVVKVEIDDGQGNRTPLVSGEDYVVLLSDNGATVRLTRFSVSTGRVVVTANVGYEDEADIPQQIKQAIAVHVGSAYAGREGQDTATPTFKNLLSAYRVAVL